MKQYKEDDEPAFPQTADSWNRSGDVPSGMDLRDYFAAHCPSDLVKCNIASDAEKIAGPQPIGKGFEKMLRWNNKVEAYLRYAYADAMLDARKPDGA